MCIVFVILKGAGLKEKQTIVQLNNYVVILTLVILRSVSLVMWPLRSWNLSSVHCF